MALGGEGGFAAALATMASSVTSRASWGSGSREFSSIMRVRRAESSEPQLTPMRTGLSFSMAGSMPMIAFSRGAYSEPVALVSTFGGLTLLWIAWQTGKLPHFFVAGLLIGVGSLARIDGGVTLIGVLAGFAVVTLAARSRELRVKAALACTAWAVGAGVLDGFSLVDGKINSPVYQSSEWGGIFPLLVATVPGVPRHRGGGLPPARASAGGCWPATSGDGRRVCSSRPW